MASDDTRPPPSDDDTRILRRAPLSSSSPGPANPEPHSGGHAPLTGEIIRRHPTGAMGAAAEPGTGRLPRAEPPAAGPPRRPHREPTWAIATSAASILSGWATAVIATNLITGWWATDRLFCVAVGFLTAISAAATIAGLIALLLRRRTGRLLVVVGSMVALLIFAALFIAGAALPTPVYAMPLLPLASMLLAALPGTARWTRPG